VGQDILDFTKNYGTGGSAKLMFRRRKESKERREVLVMSKENIDAMI